MEKALLLYLPIVLLVLGCINSPVREDMHGNLSEIYYFKAVSQAQDVSISLEPSFPMLFKNFVWNHTSITVYIDNQTHSEIPWFNEDVIKEVESAFEIWKNATSGLISFERVYSQDQADIKLMWQNFFGASENSIKIGEAQPTVYDIGLFNLSINASVSQIPYKTSCVNKIIAVHELGHALGLGHSEDPKSVMYPYAHCVRTLREPEINAVISTYSNISNYNDLVIYNVSINRTGNYFNGALVVKNQGIFVSPKINFTLSSEGHVIYSYLLDELPPGNLLSTSFKNVYLKGPS